MIVASSCVVSLSPQRKSKNNKNDCANTAKVNGLGKSPLVVGTEDAVANLFVKSPLVERLLSTPLAVLDQEETKADHYHHYEERAAADTRGSIADYLSHYEGYSGADVIYTKLEENGLEVVNGVCGGNILPVIDQFHPKHPRHEEQSKPPIRWITNSNESSAGHIAEGYSKAKPLSSSGELPVGVAVATSGPGVTNLITPLQDAMSDGIPLLVLCGQTATIAPPDAFQWVAAVELTRPCTKWSYQVRSAAELPLVMDYAFFLARHGRPGPVFIDLPKDMQMQEITTENIASFVQSVQFDYSKETSSPFARLVQKRASVALHLGTPEQGLAFEVSKDKQSIEPITQAPQRGEDLHHANHHQTHRIVKTAATSPEECLGALAVGAPMTQELLLLILKAQKPVILAGQGCNDCSSQLKQFAERLQIPVTTTLHGLGSFDERHHLSLNMLGMHGHPTANFIVQEADLIICIGSRFDDRITGTMKDFAPAAREAEAAGKGGIVHVDVRWTENKKQLTPTFFCHSTGKHFLQTMNQAMENVNVNLNEKTVASWLQRKEELQKQYPIKIPTFPTGKFEKEDASGNLTTVSRTPISCQYVVQELNRLLLEADKIEDVIVSTGVGVHQMVAAQLMTWVQPRCCISSGSLGTMGVSLGYSMGAKLANPDKTVISIDGDGSFNMTFTELKTVAEQKIPVKIVIMDNTSLMMVIVWQELFHQNRLISVENEKNPDYCVLARAFGIKALYCDRVEDLDNSLQEFLFADPDEPVLLHCRIERTPCLPMVPPGHALHNMILDEVSPPS